MSMRAMCSENPHVLMEYLWRPCEGELGLTVDEEEAVVEYILVMPDIGYGLRRENIMCALPEK